MSVKQEKIVLQSADAVETGEHAQAVKEMLESILAPGAPEAIIVYADYGEGTIGRVRCHAIGGFAHLKALGDIGNKQLLDMVQKALAAKAERKDATLN